MKNNPVFAFIGGDKRQIYVILGLAKDGYTVNVAGIDDNALIGRKNVIQCTNAAYAVEGADYIVLPVPYASVLNYDNINTPLSEQEIKVTDVFSGNTRLKNKLILAGKADDRLKALAKLSGAETADYISRDELAVLNAVPTAEGAVKIAMDELPITIHGSECLVTGFGRVGKVLCNTLKGLGAGVTTAVRKQSDMAYIKAYGYTPADIRSLPRDLTKYDIVFNTVPQPIIDDKFLRALREDCLIIDLASKPGGVDFDAAKRLGRNVIWALSLPGKAAPLTAGNIIRDTINNIIYEYGR